MKQVATSAEEKVNMMYTLHGITRRKLCAGTATALLALGALAVPNAARAAATAAEIGAWSPVMPGKAVAVHIALLPSGDIVERLCQTGDEVLAQRCCRRRAR